MNDLESKLSTLMMDDMWPGAFKKWACAKNIFDVLKVSRSETKHSNILAWLLNPKEDHGLGSQILDGLIRVICQQSDDEKVLHFLAHRWDDARVIREWGNADYRLDILIESQISKNKFAVIAIENKIDSKDRKNQLSNYYKEVSGVYPSHYNKGRVLFVYLTPDGSEPVDGDCEGKWICLSYKQVLSVIDDALLSERQISDSMRGIISNYVTTLRRNVVEDEELIRLCNMIYRKHKDAFDLVYRNADMDGAVGDAKKIIQQILKDTASQDENFIYTGERSGTQSVLSFQTKKMSDKLKPMKEGFKGTWNNSDVYYYWFNIDRRTMKVSLYLEFGPSGVDDVTKKTMTELGNIINSKKNLDGVFRRMRTLNVYTLEDDINPIVLKTKVSNSIKSILKDEETWLNRYDEEQRYY